MKNGLIQALTTCYDIATNAKEDHTEDQLDHALGRIAEVSKGALQKDAQEVQEQAQETQGWGVVGSWLATGYLAFLTVLEVVG